MNQFHFAAFFFVLAAGFATFGAGGAAHTRFRASLNGMGFCSSDFSTFFVADIFMAHKKLLITSILTKSELEAIGMVVATWSDFETDFQNSIADHLKIPKKQLHLLASTNGFSTLLLLHQHILKSLPQYAPYKSEIQTINDWIKFLQGRRNQIAHGIWKRAESNRKLMQSMGAKRASYERPEMVFSLADVRRIARAIEEMKTTLIEFDYFPQSAIPKVRRWKLLKSRPYWGQPVAPPTPKRMKSQNP